MGEILGEKAPKIFNVNWFGQDGKTANLCGRALAIIYVY